MSGETMYMEDVYFKTWEDFNATYPVMNKSFNSHNNFRPICQKPTCLDIFGYLKKVEWYFLLIEKNWVVWLATKRNFKIDKTWQMKGTLSYIFFFYFDVSFCVILAI